jgi:uncharacterized protein YjiS (DUF1127 family)
MMTVRPFIKRRRPSIALFTVIAGFLHVLANRNDFRLVAQMNDTQLRDIGLTSADVYFARGLPLSEDPTLALARRADERRHRQ